MSIDANVLIILMTDNGPNISIKVNVIKKQ